MNENEEIFDQENLLEDTEGSKDNVSNNKDNDINDKLDRIEALLNEDIALRENEENHEINITSSGSEPNYSQYIYDLLTDSNIKVEVIQETEVPFKDKKINEYNTNELLLVTVFIGFLCATFFNIVKISITNYKK